MRFHAEKDKWTEAREEVSQKVVEKSAQKTASAAASNAVKLEKARALLIDHILIALERMPESAGTRLRSSKFDKEKAQQTTVDYDLSTLVSAFEKLSTGTTADYERQKQFAAENNTVMMGYADLFRRAARQRTIEEIEAGGGRGV